MVQTPKSQHDWPSIPIFFVRWRLQQWEFGVATPSGWIHLEFWWKPLVFHSDWKCINCPLPRNWTPWTQSHQRFNEFSWCGALPTTSVKITFLLASCAAASRIFSADLPLIFPPPLFTSTLTTWHHNFFLNHIYNSNRHKKCHNYCQFGGKKQRDQIYQSSSKKSDFASASKQFFFVLSAFLSAVSRSFEVLTAAGIA